MSVKDVDIKIKDSYVKAATDFAFSQDEKSNDEIAEIKRQYAATKCIAAIKLHDRDTAALSLSNELKSINEFVDDLTSINNYKHYFKARRSKSKTDPSERKSSLVNITEALKSVSKALPEESTDFSDNAIENLVNKWKRDKEAPKQRKLPTPIIRPTPNNFTRQPQIPAKPPITNSTNNNSQFQPREKSHYFQPKNPVHRPNGIHQRHNEVKNEIETPKPTMPGFKTAKQELNIQAAKKNRQMPSKKTLGGKRPVHAQYVNPFKKEEENNQAGYGNANETGPEEPEDERLKGIDPKMIELIRNEIMDAGTKITWDDIAGLEYAKKIIQEIVVFPMLRPDIFTGLRRPPKGILLFGPPGTGKTLIGKCIASQSKSTFFSISASSLTSKWIGEGEKMVRALFAVARVHQPAVIFIDEIDSLLTQRSETEHESSRRIKTEFLVQLDGATTDEEDRILIVGATNRPYELDEAARRRLVKRLYIPLPEHEARGQIVNNLLRTERHDLNQENVQEISRLTNGYSGADMTNLCKEASMGPIRSIPFSQLENINAEQVPQVTMKDFQNAIACVRPSVSQADLAVYLDWNKTYGTGNSG